jgi:branched-chain amino acid transport system substrate-binding protein
MRFFLRIFSRIFPALALAASLALAAPAHAQLKIAVAGPMSGPSAAFGVQLKDGAQQAVEDINASGGILGQKIALVIGDDGSRPEQGVLIAKKFASEGVKFVVGHFNSSVSLAASSVYFENGVLQISPASMNPALTERRMWNVFRTSGRDDQPGVFIARHIADKLPGKKIAIIHDRTAYGQGLADDTRKALTARGLREALYEGVNGGAKDFTALIAKMRQLEIDVMVWGGQAVEGAILVRQMRERGVQALMIGGDALAAPEFANAAGPAAEGVLMVEATDPLRRPAAGAVVKKFTNRNINPDTYTLYSYASVEILKQAAEAAKSLDAKKIAGVIHSGRTFETALGPIAFDGKGDRLDLDFVMYEWRKAADGRMIFEPL